MRTTRVLVRFPAFILSLDCYAGEKNGTGEIHNSINLTNKAYIKHNKQPSRRRHYTIIIIIIIIITTTIFIVLSSTAPAICESSLWFLWAKVGQRQVAANS